MEEEEVKSEANQNEQKEEESVISNSYIKELVDRTGIKLKNYQQLVEEKQQRRKDVKNCQKKLVEQTNLKIIIILQKKAETKERQWLKQRGKSKYIDFDDKERTKLKQYFLSLDDDGSGAIDVEELEEPLISLGLAETRKDVQKIVQSVAGQSEKDEDNEIDFKKFLQIIKSKSMSGGQGSQIVDFFKDMTRGKLAGDQIDQNLPFKLIISTARRKKILDAIMSTNIQKKTEGEKVMKAYAKLIISKAQNDNQEDEQEDEDQDNDLQTKEEGQEEQEQKEVEEQEKNNQ